MATPKVFVSSTCYDLLQIRDTLSEFILSHYYEPILSEKGDVFFHPDLHTHESCVSELENCQLFILIIGGRFGGSYKLEPSKSVTNAEYEAAIVNKIPVFTFIKREVYEDHRVYQKNKTDADLVKRINFPSIEKQEYAAKIFDFIDRVRFADVNNSICSFEFVGQIKDHLGKQWAGLMFDFLSKRIKANDQMIVNQTLDNLTLINKKTEELVESIYKHIKPKEALEEIHVADKIVTGAKFYSRVLRLYGMQSFDSSVKDIAALSPTNKTWYGYLISTKEFELIENSKTRFGTDEEEDRWKDVLLWLKLIKKPIYWAVEGKINNQIMEVSNLYETFKTLNKVERVKALEMAISNISSL